MGFNLALNTIIYIMVFLFPGVIFRRTFFSGEIQSKHDAGAPIEKILWSMLWSLICIFLFYKFIYTINVLTPSNIQIISHNDVINNLIEINDNKHPSIVDQHFLLNLAAKTLIYLLAFSTILGITLNLIVCNIGLVKAFNFLKHQSYWDALSTSKKKYNNLHAIFGKHTTYLKIKLESGKVISGIFKKFFFDKDNKLETIVIKDAIEIEYVNKLENLEKYEKLVWLAENPIIDNYTISDQMPNCIECSIYHSGSILAIPNSKIQNIDIAYIKITSGAERIKSFMEATINTILILNTLFLILYSIWDFKLLPIDDHGKRIIFCIITIFNQIPIASTLIDITVKNKVIDKYFFKLSFVDLSFVFVFSIHYLYIFEIMSFWPTIGLFFLGLLIINRIRKYVTASITKEAQNSLKQLNDVFKEKNNDI